MCADIDERSGMVGGWRERMHRRFCPSCQQYAEQARFVRAACRRWAGRDFESGSARLAEAAKLRMKSALWWEGKRLE
jgi:hypothetical protein